MKFSSFLKFSPLVLILLALFACKKDIAPRLIVTVTGSDGSAVSGAVVHVYPVPNDTCQTCIVNPDMDQTSTTDGGGQASFDFKYSAVLDIDAFDISGSDTTRRGHSVVKIETVRQKSSEANDYQASVEIL